MTEPKPAIVYLRQSSARPNETSDTSLSLDSQETAVIEWAGRNGYQVTEIVRDHDEVGRSMARPGLDELRARIRPGMTILVWKYDRFARNLLGQEQVVQELQRFGCAVVSTTEGSDKFVRQIFGSVAEYFSDQLSDRLRLAVRTRVMRGAHAGDIPYGYDRAGRLAYTDKHGHAKVRRTGPLIVDRERAPVIARLFARWCAGDSLRSIVMALEREQVQGPSGNGWTPQTVAWQLRNPIYAGGVRIHGHIVWDAGHEPIVSRETWDAAQLRFVRATIVRHTDRPHWCAGLVRHSCGDRMSVNEVSRPGGGRYPSYRCNAAGRPGQRRCTDPRQHIGAPLLDRAVRRCLTLDLGDRLDFDAALRTAIDDAGSASTDGERVRLLDARQRHLDTRDRSRRSYLAGLDDFETWAATAREIDAAVAHIDAEIARLPSSPDATVYQAASALLRDLAAGIATADTDQLRAILTELGTIVVSGAGVTIAYWPPYRHFIMPHTIDPRAA